MGTHNAVVAIYNTHTEAEAAIQELKRAAFDIAKLSIIGRDYTQKNTWWGITTPATA